MRPLPVGVRSAGNGAAAGENIRALSPEFRVVSFCVRAAGFVGLGVVSTSCALNGKTAAAATSKKKNARPKIIRPQDRHLPMEKARFWPASVPIIGYAVNPITARGRASGSHDFAQTQVR